MYLYFTLILLDFSGFFTFLQKLAEIFSGVNQKPHPGISYLSSPAGAGGWGKTSGGCAPRGSCAKSRFDLSFFQTFVVFWLAGEERA
jgi:hypothetical protein